jgi:uncharacterized protein (DUF2336 family)
MGHSRMLIRDLYGRVGEMAPDRRALTLRHLTDLYLVGAEQFSSDDVALIDDIFVRLLEAIDDSARALLASRLAPLAKAPPKVLHRLACDDMIDVAAVVLKQSEAVNDATLIECAVTKTQGHMLAISQRKTLSEAVTDVLVKRGDREVLLSTANNAGARFSKSTFAVLVKRAQGDDALTGCVGRRPDLPPALFEKLLEAASDAVRATLERERRHTARDIDQAVNEVAAQIRRETTTQTQAQATARVRIHSLNRAGKLNRLKLEEFAKAGRSDELTIALALMAHVPEDVVTDIFNDPDREPLLALAKTVKLPWETTRIILARLASGGSPEADSLKKCQAAFEQLHQPDARVILDARCARLLDDTATH